MLCAIGLFVYQALDATDGKQARRTGSASPLGELFDHGCDSLSQGIFAWVGMKLIPNQHKILSPFSAGGKFCFYRKINDKRCMNNNQNFRIGKF